MQNAETLNPEQIREFLKSSEAIAFAGQSQGEKYAWAQQLLVGQEYASQGKKDRGLIRAYLCKMTGLSMPQTARLVQMYRETGVVVLNHALLLDQVFGNGEGCAEILAARAVGWHTFIVRSDRQKSKR